MASTTEAPVRPGHHSRGFSFHSRHSHGSGGSKGKVDLTESPKDKAAHYIHTHADPTRAMQEMQPSAMALEQSNMQSLRSVQHKDRFGNAIVDPDLSNPTRHRFERPLETIRAFEAAIDGTSSNRRQSYARPDDNSNAGYSRPNSYFGDRSAYPNHSYSDVNGHYNGRGNQSRPDSYADSYSQYNNYGNAAPRPPRHAQRTNGDQYYSQGYDQYPNSTDPSSMNSSVDRLQQQHPHVQHQRQMQMQDDRQQQQQHSGESFGFSGFGANPQLDYPQSPYSDGYGGYTNGHTNGYTNGHTNGQTNGNANGYRNGATPVPAPPPKDGKAANGTHPTQLQKGKSKEKRKSWLKRFSKS